jgi:hypothetical protein
MVAGGMFGVCVWFGWLFERWWGLALRPLGMSLQSEAPSRVSFWVALCGCSFVLTNGGRHYWGSEADGPVNSNGGEAKVTNAITRHVATDTEILANQ